MIDVVHTTRGKSFKGLIAYLMEGSKGAENPDRVEYSFTRNLATGNAKMAGRVMAYTAMDQARLKQDADIANTGRKSKNHLMHYTLSWPAGKEVEREEVLEAVDGSLAVLGEKKGQKGGRKGKEGRIAVRTQFATEHQVLAVVHNDSKAIHVHVVVNRIHPEHGVMLPSSRDFLKLSKWAERFERDHGGIIVDQRAVNNAERAKGKRVYAKKRPSRDVYELEKAARENHPEALRIQKQQQAKQAKLAKRSAGFRQKSKEDWDKLQAGHKQQHLDLRAKVAKDINTARRKIQDDYAEKWRNLHLQQKADVEAFEKAETTLLGKASHALGSLLSLQSGVNVLWSQGARTEAFRATQEQQKRDLERQEQKKKEEATRRIQANLKLQRVARDQMFFIKRQGLILKQQMGKAALRSAWKSRQAERKRVWEGYQLRMAQRPPERSYGRQMVEADDRIRELIKSNERRMERQKAKKKERGRGGDGRDR